MPPAAGKLPGLSHSGVRCFSAEALPGRPTSWAHQGLVAGMLALSPQRERFALRFFGAEVAIRLRVGTVLRGGAVPSFRRSLKVNALITSSAKEGVVFTNSWKRFKSMGNNRASLFARADALRAVASISDISPINAPGGASSTTDRPMTTSTSPSMIMYIIDPGSPLRKMYSPAA